ncbi:MAG: FAD-dependent oxidoreductase [Thaumarchaeota archaeon]|nr:FAD-dependent oxidoreductase [Nitrososphaerota archaeon]
MTRVIVVGGGTAGAEAAKEASRCGATVSLLEASGALGLDQCLFPSLLSRRPATSALSTTPEELSDKFGVEVELGRRVRRVDFAAKTVHGDWVQDGPANRRYDSLVVATGASSVPDEIKGSSKPGVWPLRSEADFLSLARALPGLSNVSIVGSSALLALAVAQEVYRATRCRLFVSGGGLGALSPGIRSRVVTDAASKGVAVVDAGVQAVVGMKRVEAVVALDVVHPCDAVVLLPRSSPSTPQLECARGVSGGIVVDGTMRSSQGGVFAAGDCAELRVGAGSVPFKVHSSAVTMGRTAGSNAAGGRVAQAAVAGTLALDLFGAQLCTAGLQVTQGRAVGLNLVEMEEGSEPEGALKGSGFQTSVIFERDSHHIYGLQARGEGAALLSGHISMIVSAHSSLEEVAGQDSPGPFPSGSEVSPICLTARKLLSRLRG